MQKKYIFGIDIGGTTIKNGLFTVDGELLEKWEIPTRIIEDGKHILDDITKSVFDKLSERGIETGQVIGIGLGVPGPVGEDGTVYRCVNTGWGVFNVEESLKKKTGLPVRAGNDANVATLGEMWKGGGAGYNDIIMITIGTGIGGGIVIDGKILPGNKGVVGEIGHMRVLDTEKEKCSCGRYGCLQQYASSNGIISMARRVLDSRDTPSTLRETDELTAKVICDAAREGDEMGLVIIDKAGKLLGKALAQTACVISPSIFIVGGGLSSAGDILLDTIIKYYNHYAFHASRDIKFTLAKLGNDAGIYGASKLLIE